jgi:hypothetical protein
MRAAVLYFDECPNWRAAGQRLRQALDEVGRHDIEVTFLPVAADTVSEFAGSPTFIVDGTDLFPAGAEPGGLSCRMYQTAAGLAGAPEVADLVAALRERLTP